MSYGRGVLTSFQFIKDCRRDERCSQYFHDFLDLVQKHMLVVELDGSSEDVSRPFRPSCKAIERTLQKMYLKCSESGYKS